MSSFYFRPLIFHQNVIKMNLLSVVHSLKPKEKRINNNIKATKRRMIVWYGRYGMAMAYWVDMSAKRPKLRRNSLGAHASKNYGATYYDRSLFFSFFLQCFLMQINTGQYCPIHYKEADRNNAQHAAKQSKPSRQRVLRLGPGLGPGLGLGWWVHASHQKTPYTRINICWSHTAHTGHA